MVHKIAWYLLEEKTTEFFAATGRNPVKLDGPAPGTRFQGRGSWVEEGLGFTQ